MNIKEQWYDKFQELLWKYHTCDWEYANKNPDYLYQLAVAYFDWGLDGKPEETPEESFTRYVEAQDD